MKKISSLEDVIDKFYKKKVKRIRASSSKTLPANTKKKILVEYKYPGSKNQMCHHKKTRNQ